MSIWVGRDGEGTIFSMRAEDDGDTARVVGSVLLGVSLAAILLATLFWWWRGGDRWPSRQAY